MQYNASIRTPMARNIGEVLGVGGMINLPGKGGENWNSTVNVRLFEKHDSSTTVPSPCRG